MKPMAAALISPNFEFFKELIDLEKKSNGFHFDSIRIEDLSITHRIHSFASYLCKKHRLTQGRNEELKQIFSYLRIQGYVITSEEDKKCLFRQLIMSWNLGEDADVERIWDDYRGIVKSEDISSVFDLYKGRDMKMNNMRLIMAKNYNESFDNCVVNMEKYAQKYGLDLNKVEEIFLKQIAFENIRA